MTAFINEKFEKFILADPMATVQDKIEKFLMLEFSFTEYIGYELTCLAYAMNFSACVPGPCEHLDKRTFSIKLKELLQQGEKAGIFMDGYTAEKTFLYLETSVRGMMASWCFANGEFSIVETGGSYLQTVLTGIYR